VNSHRSLLRRGLRIALVCSVAAPLLAEAAGPLYDASATTREVRFGGTVGSGVLWTPSTPQSLGAAGFAGRAALTCSGLDYGAFLKGYDAGDFLRELRNQFISGAQAAAMNYLIVLAYSNPTIASVLDTMNHSYSAKFGSFQLACNTQEAKRQGLSEGARRMAAAQDQCYESQVDNGASPTQAYQACADEETLGSLAAGLPAAKSVLDFIRDHTSLQPTAAVTALFGLLPDTRIGANGLEVSPPRVTLYQFNQNAEVRIANALQRVLDGDAPATVQDCAPQSYFVEPSDPGEACLPGNFAGVIQSPAFLGARGLSPSGKQLYRDALASQIAIAATRSAILDLMSQVRQLNVRDGGGASANDVLERKKELQEQIAVLGREADALQAFQQAKANTIRTQILATDLASSTVEEAAATPPPRTPSSFIYDLLRGLVSD
jgi:hypothetical protein